MSRGERSHCSPPGYHHPCSCYSISCMPQAGDRSTIAGLTHQRDSFGQSFQDLIGCLGIHCLRSVCTAAIISSRPTTMDREPSGKVSIVTPGMVSTQQPRPFSASWEDTFTSGVVFPDRCADSHLSPFGYSHRFFEPHKAYTQVIRRTAFAPAFFTAASICFMDRADGS